MSALICHCTMAGTQACKNCPRYKEYFGEQTGFGIDKKWLEEVVKKAVREELTEVMGGEE